MSESQPGTPWASVVIPSLDGSRGGNVERLCASLRESLGDDVEIEVVVGIQPSGLARNVGVAKTRGRILVLLDDDVTIRGREVLEALRRALDDHPDLGLVGTAQLLPPGSAWWQRRAGREIPRSSCPVVERLTDSDMVTTACCAIRRGTWDRLGGMHPGIWRGDDPAFRVRVRAAGLRVALVPGVWHYHPMPPTIGAFVRMAWRNGLGSARLYRCHPALAYETPANYLETDIRNIGLPRRAIRGVARLFAAALLLRPFLFAWQLLYVLGYVAGRLLPLPQTSVVAPSDSPVGKPDRREEGASPPKPRA